MKRNWQHGQAMAEYLLCTSVLAGALLVPWSGEASVLVQCAQVLRNGWQAMNWLLSLS